MIFLESWFIYSTLVVCAEGVRFQPYLTKRLFMRLVSPGPFKQPNKFNIWKAGIYHAMGKKFINFIEVKGSVLSIHFYQELWFSFSAKTVSFVWPHKNIIASLNNSAFKFKSKGSANVLFSSSLQTQIQLCSWKWREQALIQGKTTIIPLSIAFTLVYLALLMCFCTATWQYDTFTFWLETYPPKHLVGNQKTMTALQQRNNNLYCRNQKVKPKRRKTRKKRRQWMVEEKRLGTKKWRNKKKYYPGCQQIRHGRC